MILWYSFLWVPEGNESESLKYQIKKKHFRFWIRSCVDVFNFEMYEWLGHVKGVVIIWVVLVTSVFSNNLTVRRFEMIFFINEIKDSKTSPFPALKYKSGLKFQKFRLGPDYWCIVSAWPHFSHDSFWLDQWQLQHRVFILDCLYFNLY